jgi:hypothetical protein
MMGETKHKFEAWWNSENATEALISADAKTFGLAAFEVWARK